MATCSFSLLDNISAQTILQGMASFYSSMGASAQLSNGVLSVQEPGSMGSPSSGFVAQANSGSLSFGPVRVGAKVLPMTDHGEILGAIGVAYEKAGTTYSQSQLSNNFSCSTPHPRPTPASQTCKSMPKWDPSSSCDSGSRMWQINCGDGDSPDYRGTCCADGYGADTKFGADNKLKVGCYALGCSGMGEEAPCYSDFNYPNIMDGNCEGGQCVSIGAGPQPGPAPVPPHHGPQPQPHPVPPHHGPQPHPLPPHHGPQPHPVPPVPPHHQATCTFNVAQYKANSQDVLQGMARILGGPGYGQYVIGLSGNTLTVHTSTPVPVGETPEGFVATASGGNVNVGPYHTLPLMDQGELSGLIGAAVVGLKGGSTSPDSRRCFMQTRR